MRLQTWFWEPRDRLRLLSISVHRTVLTLSSSVQDQPETLLSRLGPIVFVHQFYLEVRYSSHLLPGYWLRVAPGSAHSFQPEEQTCTAGQVSISSVLQSSWMRVA